MPPQATNKQFEFVGTAGSFFGMYILSLLLMFVPFVGFVFAFNNQNAWLMKNIKVNGRTLAYKAEFGEVFVLMLVGILLAVVTFGIYIFWFVPKLYRFVADHTSYADEAAPAPVAPAADPTPVAAEAFPTTPTVEPTAPTSPTNLVQ